MPAMVQVREDAVNVFTDGSSLSGPRLGDIGIRLVTIGDDGKEVCEDEFLLGYCGATSQQMEVLACLKGIQTALRHPRFASPNRIRVFTDSQYAARNVDNAKVVWPAAQWRTKAETPVLDAKLWKDLVTEIRKAGCRIDIPWATRRFLDVLVQRRDIPATRKMPRRCASGGTLPKGAPRAIAAHT